MSKDKYYTPTIKEFHVGFECETETISSNGDKGWAKETLTLLGSTPLDKEVLKKP